MLNLLTEPLFRLATIDGIHKGTLPDVYAALMTNKVETFPALRPHQRHAWHAFLVQLGAMALHRADISEPPGDAASWEMLLRGLTVTGFPGDEPWQLVVKDITQPAFMQSPASSWKDYNRKQLLLAPDTLDMLDTAKNHEHKKEVAINADAEDWAFALITMQTMNGQVGRGHYPIARMNSGDGSRTSFSISPSLHLGAHLRRDMTILLERSSEIVLSLPFQWDGLGLLWTERWDGECMNALLLSQLHPFYIEICQRRRLSIDEDGCLFAMKAISNGRRIAAEENRGVVGDPWTLVDHRDKKGDKALTLQKDGFTYRKVMDYLTSGDWGRPLLWQSTQSECDEPMVYLLMRGVRRKKGGQTEGYYERAIPIKGKMRNAMLRRSGPGSVEELGNLAQRRIEHIATVQHILLRAIQKFAAGGGNNNISQKDTKKYRKLAQPWLNKLDEIIDLRFFDDLQDEFEADAGTEQNNIHNTWLRDFVVPQARSILHNAMNSLPCLTNRRYRALVNAEGLFEGRLRSNGGLPFLFDDAAESTP